jgi:hypothetical protein
MADLAEVVDGVGGVPGATSDPDNEQPPATITNLHQALGHGLELGRID